MASSTPINIGIVGLGNGAMNALPELRANPNAKIVAGADPRPQALERFKSEIADEVYADAEQLCASPNVDVVYILTPDDMHARHAVAAAENGKQVLLDKPMGLTLEECDSVIEAAERNGVRVIVGHSQSLDPPVLKMAAIVNSGRLGKPVMVHTVFYSDWIYRPRVPEELLQERGGSIVRRQGPIQADIVRMMGGGMVRSVRGSTHDIDPERPIDGSYTAFLQFDDGHVGTMTYDGYGHFNSAELTFGYTLAGAVYDPDLHRKTRERVRGFGSAEAEAAFKESSRYGGSQNRSSEQTVSPDRRQSFFGLTIVSCEHGDIRQTPTGVVIHGDYGDERIDVDSGDGFTRRYGAVEVDEMHAAMAEDRPVRIHDARWGKATLEVVLGIIQSSAERREVEMRFQVPYRGQGVA
jgi:phthalate 4,5-cis-dihydrodiol dehydrogenase